MQENHKQEMIETLKQYESLCRTRSVVVFGHCNGAQELVDYLHSLNLSVCCYMDNSTQKQGKTVQGLPVLPPERIAEFTKEDSIVLIITKFYSQMSHQLKQLGYEGEIVEVVSFQGFSNFSIEDQVFFQKQARVEEGYGMLTAIQSTHPQDFLLLCPFAALGDVYWALSYLPAYCEVHGISSCTIGVVGKGCEKVATLFGYEHILTLTQEKMDALVQAVVFTQEKKALIAHHDRLYTDKSLQILQKHALTFTQCYQQIVYGLPKEAEEVTPSVVETLSEELKSQMPPGKSVILAPYAHSIPVVGGSFWEDLVKEYEEKGFAVWTNVAPDQEALKGSKALCLPLSAMSSAVEWAGHFVGMRSGLCDVVHGAKGEKTLVYPSCYFSGTTYLVSDFYALEGWHTVVVSESEG